MNERRGLARHKTFIKGRIYFNNRLSSMDCIVRDVSDTGGRLEVSESVPLPDAFEVYLPAKHESFFARVQWRRGNSLGISWTQGTTPLRAEPGSVEQTIVERLEKLEREVAALQRRLDSMQEL